MKRYAAQIGLTSFSVLAAAFYCPDTVTFIVMAAAAAAGPIFLLIRKTRRAIVPALIAFTVALSCAVNLCYTAFVVDPVTERFSGESRRIEATLTDEEYRQYAKYYYRLKANTVDGEEANVRILLKTDAPLDIEPYDKITFTADICPTVNRYYLSKGYYITVNSLDIQYSTYEGDSYPLYYHVIRLRQAMRDALDSYLPSDESDLCKAILIGDKYALDRTVVDEFRECGASYLIVVSGMHFSVICFLSMWLFKKFFRKRVIYFPMTYLVVILYMMLTGFQPSVMRSGMMMLILVTGKMSRRISDPLTSLGIAGVCMPLIFSPYGCGDIGMILSFAATFSIIMWQGPIYHKISFKYREDDRTIARLLKRAVNAVLAILSVSLAANILTLPLSVFLFNGYSHLTMLSAIVLYPCVWLILALSLSVCVLFWLGPLRYLSLLLSWPLYAAARSALWLIERLSSLPFAYIHIKSAYVYLWISITLAIGLTAYFLRKRRRLYPYAALLSAILFFSGMIVNTVVQLHTDRLEVSGGKEGMTVCLERYGRLHMLRFDCDSDTAYRTLMDLSDRYGGAETAICTAYNERVNYNRMTDREFPISHYLVSRDVKPLFTDELSGETFGGGSVFILDDGVILHTVENDAKQLLYLTDDDSSVMLIPANFPFEAIPPAMRHADVIIFGKALKDYDKLSCDTLIRSPVRNIPDEAPLPEHRILYDISEENVSIGMAQITAD